MGSFTTGFCVGLGLCLLFTPKKGEEMRHLVGERIRALRASSPENQELNPAVTELGVRLQETQNRAEQTRPMGATTPSSGTIQQATSSTVDVQQDLNRVAQPIGTTTPTGSPVQQTASSMRETQQELNRDVQQAGSITPGTTQETMSSVEDTQKDLNSVIRPPRRPGSLADQ